MPVGATLSQLRRDRGRSLAEVESATRIMGRMLSALENERWNELPAPVYVKGYIQNYASFLGVPAAPLLEEYAHDIEHQVERVERPALRHIPERTVVPHRLAVHEIPRRVWIAIAVAAAVVVLAAWGITALVGREETPPPIAPESTATVEPTTTATTTDTGDGAFELTVEVLEGQSSWVQVRVDSLLAYEGTMPGGERKSWTVSKDAVIRVGKPAAVHVTRDGQSVEIPAVADGIAELTLNAGIE